MRGYRRWGWMFAGALLAAAAGGGALGLLALSGWFITACALAGSAAVLDIYRPAAAIRALALIRTVARYGERLVGHDAALRLLAGLRCHVFERVAGLDAARLGRLRRGQVLARLTADVDILDQLYLRILAPAMAVGLLLAVGVPLLVLVLPPATAAPVITAVVMAAAVPIMAAGMGRRDGPMRDEAFNELRAATVESVDGIAELCAHQAYGVHRARVARIAGVYQRAHRRLARLSDGAGAVATLAVYVAAGLALYNGIAQLGAGLSGPILVMVALALLGFAEQVAPVAAAATHWRRYRTAARRIQQFAETPAAVTGPPVATPPPAHGGLELDAVTFRYQPTDTPVLYDLSLALPEAGYCVVTGPSGAGKSTVLALAARLWDPDRGTVRFAGVDLRSMDPEAFQRRIAYVPQRPQLFSATVAENLRLGAPGASSRALWRVLDAAGLAGLVSDLPHGLDTWLGEAGLRLSGGEARRLAVARALLQDAPVMLLDEPAAGLDNDSADVLVRGLEQHLAGRTAIIAAHDTYRIPRTQRIVRLDRGRIADRA